MLVYCQKPNCSKCVAADQLAGSRPDLSGSRSRRSVDFFSDNKKEALDLGLIEEEPLSIRI